MSRCGGRQIMRFPNRSYSARLFRWGALAQPYLDRSTGHGRMMRTHLTRIRKHTKPALISLLSCDYGTPSHAIAIYQNTNSSGLELLGFECNTTMQTSKKGKAKVVIHVGLMQRCQIQMEGVLPMRQGERWMLNMICRENARSNASTEKYVV